jgi:hypothetical protein
MRDSETLPVLGQLILSCARTGRFVRSGFQASRDDIRHVPPKWMVQMACGVCHRVHEFNLAEARVCECLDERCRPYGACQRCEFAVRSTGAAA